MAIHKISADLLSIAVDSFGAELSSIQRRDHQTEYLWPGNPATWNGRAPILFPIIGPLLEGRYELAGRNYQMKQHGFARRSEWQLAESAGDFLLFRLEETEDSLRQYPFRFALEAGYHIRGAELECSYRVINKEKERLMPFAIGSHTAFRVPIAPDLSFSDYELEFAREEDTVRYLQTSAGPLSGETVAFRTEGRRLELQHSFFAAGSIVFKNLLSERISIRSSKDGRQVSIAFAGFPYCTLWTYLASCEPYLCIEPWYGVAPTLGSSINLLEREGSQLLKAGEEFRCAFQITLE